MSVRNNHKKSNESPIYFCAFLVLSPTRVFPEAKAPLDLPVATTGCYINMANVGKAMISHVRGYESGSLSE